MSLVDFFLVDSIAYDGFERAARERIAKDATFSSEIRSCFERWTSAFESLYARERLTERLYFHHALLIAVAGLLLKTKVGKEIGAISSGVLKTFYKSFTWVASLQTPVSWTTFVKTVKLATDDMFNKIYPSLLPQSTKHASGEYYTPANLARLMVEERFTPGQVAIDPSCGSGTFVLELYRSILESPLSVEEKIACLANIVGIDKNPLAIFMTRVNLEFIMHEHGIQDFNPKLYNNDSLFLGDDEYDYRGHVPLDSVDLVIGNPPWVVLGGIEHAGYKERLKQLATEQAIYVGGKNTSNLEMSSLFLHGFKDRLKPGGWVFFIMPNSMITGSQNARARAFAGFEAVNVWRFTRQPFKIHSVCIAARKMKEHATFNHVYPFVTIHVKQDGAGELNFVKGTEERYEPVMVERNVAGKHVVSVGRLIPAKEREGMLPRQKSPYMDLFYKGAQIFPRKFFFVDASMERGHKEVPWVTVRPSQRVQAKKLARWNFDPYTESRFELDFLFKVAKSTGLVPFTMIELFDAFLPYRRVPPTNQLVECTGLAPGANEHFTMLERVFATHAKQGASHTSLRQIINYQNCMVNPRQGGKLKVVYNGGGSIVKGAIVDENAIVDYSMFYYPARDIDEAHYLLGFLNAPELTENVKLIGSTGFHGSLRNIVKHPFDFPLPIFDKNDTLHQEIATLGRKGRELSIALLGRLGVDVHAGTPGDDATRLSLQSRILEDTGMKSMLASLDGAVKTLLDRETSHLEA